MFCLLSLSRSPSECELDGIDVELLHGDDLPLQSTASSGISSFPHSEQSRRRMHELVFVVEQRLVRSGRLKHLVFLFSGNAAPS